MVYHEMDMDLNNDKLWNGHGLEQWCTIKWAWIWKMVYYKIDMDVNNCILWNGNELEQWYTKNGHGFEQWYTMKWTWFWTVACYEMVTALNNAEPWNGHGFEQCYTMKWLCTQSKVYHEMAMTVNNGILCNGNGFVQWYTMKWPRWVWKKDDIVWHDMYSINGTLWNVYGFEQRLSYYEISNDLNNAIHVLWDGQVFEHYMWHSYTDKYKLTPCMQKMV